MSKTYTAIYERDGDTWIAQIAEEPHVQSRAASVPEARQSIRDALAQWLKTNSGEFHIVDDFRLPAPIRAARKNVQETRTEDERVQMMARMTDSKPAKVWIEELGIAQRDPVTVQCLERLLGDKEVSIDTFCHTITMAEEMTRLAATGDGVILDGARTPD